MHTLFVLSTELVAVTHLTMAVVLFIYARRSVSYLAQAWINLLTFVIYGIALGIIVTHPIIGDIGMLNPVLLLALLVVSFLLSINPLGMVLPGYLQLGRMVRYALPAAALLVFYGIALLAGSRPVHIHTLDDLLPNLLTGDVLLRILSLVLSSYYIINILVIPHRLIRTEGYSLPANVISYASLLGFVQLFFVFVTIWVNVPLLIVYEVLFTAVSIMLSGCMIHAQLEVHPYPEIHLVDAPPTPLEITEAEQQDFNEANNRRFASIEYAMQHEKPFTASDFTRDTLCRLSGCNRHILLQTLRSQGYNDVHDYITRYRVTELRRLIENGEITDIHETDRVGFRTIKTAVLAFDRYEHIDLTSFIKKFQ